jgi:hypothetical protein
MEPDMKESWTIRTTAEQRAYESFTKPNGFGKYDLWIRTDALADQPELLDGLSYKPIRRPDEPGRIVGMAHVRAGSQYAPRVKLEPLAGDLFNARQLEDFWLREHALAASLNRQMRLGAVSLIVSRSDLRNNRWFRPDRGYTHALWLNEVIVHEVLT